MDCFSFTANEKNHDCNIGLAELLMIISSPLVEIVLFKEEGYLK